MQQIDLEKLVDILKFDPKMPLMFNSGFFLVFFFVIIIIFTLIKRRIEMRNVYLMLISFFFYYKTSGLYVLLLLLVTVFDFIIARNMNKYESRNIRLTLLLMSVGINIGFLSYFKYTNFFGEMFARVVNYEFTPIDIILPVGISFFIFQSLSYTIDVYMKKMEPLKRYIDYAFYVSFFPQLVAGPIVRAKDFIPQIARETVVTQSMFGRGMYLIMSGLFKKVIISDYISVNFVDKIFENPTLYSGFENLISVYCYALQIYCDFSGYSDIAIGLALLLGFRFSLNFDSPYQSSSITEFWRRWHISLSGWLRDYLYIPLGGNKKGKFRSYLNLMTTMLLGGLWHGASLQFVLWGAWHGLLLGLDKLRCSYLPYVPKKMWQFYLMKVLGVIVTFHLVCFGWIFFRAPSFDIAKDMIMQISNGVDFSLLPQFIVAYRYLTVLIIVGFALHLQPRNTETWACRVSARMPLLLKSVVMAIFIFIIIQVRSIDVVPFIYFQF